MTNAATIANIEALATAIDAAKAPKLAANCRKAAAALKAGDNTAERRLWVVAAACEERFQHFAGGYGAFGALAYRAGEIARSLRS